MTKSSEARIERRRVNRDFGPVASIKPHTPDRKALHGQLSESENEDSTRMKYLHVTKGWREHDRSPANRNAWKIVMQRAQKFHAEQAGV